MLYLLEIDAITDSIGTSTTLRYTDGNFTTEPGETPANAFYEPRISDPGLIRRDLFSDRRIIGSSKIGIGDIVLINNDGGLDSIKNYGFDGQLLTLRYGEDDAAYPSGFDTVFSGTVASSQFNLNTVIFKVRDKQQSLNIPVCDTRYAGDNSLPNGLEGTPSDIGGSVKPCCFGSVFNISPIFINTSKLTFQVNDGAVNDIGAVYDRGVSITKSTNHATSALLQAATVTAGTYQTCFAEGYFRLGTNPAGLITCDVDQGATAADRTAAKIIEAIALQVGLTAGEISSSDITALDTANSSVVGIWIDTDLSAIEALDQVSASVGAWYGFDTYGVLRMQQTVTPASPTVTLDTTEIVDIEKVQAKDSTGGLPFYRVNLKFEKNYSTQSEDLAGAVTAARRAFLNLEYRTDVSEDTAILTKHLLAPELTVETLLTTSANAATESARLLALHKVERDVYQVDVSLNSSLANSLDLGVVVSLVYNRFNLGSGKDFMIIGIDADFSKSVLKLTLWG